MICTYENPYDVLVPERFVRLAGMPPSLRGAKNFWVLSPGRMVVHHHDKQSSGMIVAMVDDTATVMWSRDPRTREDIMTEEMARQISQEIDREIIQDLTSRGRT